MGQTNVRVIEFLGEHPLGRSVIEIVPHFESGTVRTNFWPRASGEGPVANNPLGL